MTVHIVRFRSNQIIFYIFWVLVSFWVLPHPSAADVYCHVDEDQVVHLTNVPMGSQYRVLIRERPPDPVPVSGIPSASEIRLAPDSAPYDELIAGTAAKYGVEGALVKAVIRAESNFNHRAVSKKGARGLMQLMPQTALMLRVGDCFLPGENIDGGIRYLSYLFRLYGGDLVLTLAAYNAGEGAVAQYGGVPPYAETQTYLRQVLKHYERYQKEAKSRVSASLHHSLIDK